jgi:hypothetical protein
VYLTGLTPFDHTIRFEALETRDSILNSGFRGMENGN